MSLDPRAVALLGIGCIPAILARIGYFDAETGDEPIEYEHLYSATCSVVEPKRRRRSRRQPEVQRADVLLGFGIGIQSTAGMALGAAAASALAVDVSASVGLRLGAAARGEIAASVTAEADVVDVLLEFLLAL